MQYDENNPLTNVLGLGVTPDMVEEAVRKSGYPLQTLVAQSLKPLFAVREEWSFRDADSGELRALDILAERSCGDDKVQSRVRPAISLLIECKQSDLPYIFFLASTNTWLPEFPALAGLFGNRISATTDDSISTWSLTIQEALGMDEDPFLKEGPTHCMSLSKCMRKGKALEVSGAETFNGIVLPLVKAIQDFQKQNAPPSTALYHDMHAVLAVAVVDAPMIAVNVTGSGQELIYKPWVRVIRHQTLDADHKLDRHRTYAIDVVHSNFLDVYIKDHVLPFAERFGEKTLKHSTEIVTGKAFVPQLNARSFEAFDDMVPQTVIVKAKRAESIIRRLIKFKLHRR